MGRANGPQTAQVTGAYKPPRTTLGNLDQLAEAGTYAVEKGAEGLRGVAHTLATPFTEAFRVAKAGGKALEDSGVVNKQYFPVSGIPDLAEQTMASPFTLAEQGKEKLKQAVPGAFDPSTRLGRVASATADVAALGVGTVLGHKIMAGPKASVERLVKPKDPAETLLEAVDPEPDGDAMRRVKVAPRAAEAKALPDPIRAPVTPDDFVPEYPRDYRGIGGDLDRARNRTEQQAMIAGAAAGDPRAVAALEAWAGKKSADAMLVFAKRGMEVPPLDVRALAEGVLAKEARSAEAQAIAAARSEATKARQRAEYEASQRELQRQASASRLSPEDVAEVPPAPSEMGRLMREDAARRFGSERGRTLNPADAADALDFRYAPGVNKYESSTPGLMLDQKLAMSRSRSNSSAQTAQEKAMSLQRTFNEQEKFVADKYLVAKDELARAQDNLQVTGGRSITELQNEVTNAAAQMDPAKLAAVESEYRAWSDEVFDRLVTAGVLDPRSKRSDYVPNLVKRYQEEAAAFQGRSGGGVSQSKPGQTKQAQGHSTEIERDPYRAMAFADHLSRKALVDSEFRKEVVGKHGLTNDVRLGRKPFDPETHALYSFGGPGKAEILVGSKAQDAVNFALSKRQPIMIGDRYYDVLPRDLAEGLYEVGKPTDLGGIGKGLAFTGKWGRDTQLLVNPQFQLAQWPADTLTALMNVPFNKWPGFGVSFVKNVGKMAKAYLDTAGNKFSAHLAEMRDKGLLTETWETLASTAEPTHVVKNLTPLKASGNPVMDTLRSIPDKAVRAVQAVGQIRETALKAALAEQYIKMGAAPERAAFWANRVTGKYLMTSKSGRLVGLNVPLLKWYMEQLQRLTIDVATDPATGKWSARGLASGPVPKIVALAAIQHLINNRNPDTAKVAANLPSHLKTGFVAGKNEDGTWNVIKPDTLHNLASAALDTFMEAKEYGPGKALEGIKETVAGRLNPLWKILGQAATPEQTNGMSTRALKEENAKRGGLSSLTPKGQEMLETAGGAIPRLARTLSSEDTTDPTATYRVLGFPMFRTTEKAKVAEEAAKYGRLIEQRWIDARDKGDVEGAQAAQDWLRQHGWDEAKLKRLATLGKKREKESDNLTREERSQRKRRRLTPYEAE